MHHKTVTTHQSGVVSILTVLMFSILIGVLLTGFTRLMIQEQQDTLQDDLSKSAYNSAQAGIEDAKRALQFCAVNNNIDQSGKACSNLYNPVCPGFNSIKYGRGAFEDIGIAAPSASGTTVGDADVNQRYTCVIISKSDTIEATLGDSSTTNNGAMYELSARGGAQYNAVEIRWHNSSDGAPTLASAAVVSNLAGQGNVRQPDWPYPALMRTTIVAAEDTLATAPVSKTAFIYPTNGSGAGASTNYQTMNSSIFATCSPTAVYACSHTILLPNGQVPPHRFIMLQPFYKGTSLSIKLKNGSNDVPMDGAQTTVDATGAAAGVFRRVQAQVAPGKPISSGAALDVGNSVCKDFFVSAETFNTISCN